MTWLNTILGGPYGFLVKWGGIALLVLGIFGTGYYQGSKREKTIIQTKLVQHVVTQYRDVIRLEQPKEAAQLKSNKDKYDQALLQVPQVVMANPDCDLNPDAIRLLNSARGSLPAQP